MCVYMGGGIPLQLTATPRPALLFLKSLATGRDWPRPGLHQPPGAEPGPHCLFWGRLDAPEAGPGQPRAGGAGATAPRAPGARPGRGQIQVPGGKRGCSPGGPSGTKPRSECHVSRNPLLTLGQHSTPARASVPQTTPICAASDRSDSLVGSSSAFAPLSPQTSRPQPAGSHSRPVPPDLPSPLDSPARCGVPELLPVAAMGRPRSWVPS